MKRRFSALAATVIAASAAVCASAQCFTAFAGSDAVQEEAFEGDQIEVIERSLNAHVPAEDSGITVDQAESVIAGAHAPTGDNETATQTTAAAASAATTTTTTTVAPVQTTVSTTEEVIWETMTKKYDAHAPIEEPMTLPAEPASTDAASTASSASTNGSSENKSTNKNNAPQTGDTFPAVGLTLAAVTAAFGAFALRNNNND